MTSKWTNMETMNGRISGGITSMDWTDWQGTVPVGSLSFSHQSMGAGRQTDRHHLYGTCCNSFSVALSIMKFLSAYYEYQYT